jgi:sensor domain CHASE-containing protein
MRRVRRIFICSPFRGDVQSNEAIARAACRRVLDQGDAPFAPHLLYPELLDDAVAEERDRGIRAGIAWLQATDEMLVVGEPSEGMRREIEAAELLGIPIRRIASVALGLVLALVACAGCVGARPAAAPATITPPIIVPPRPGGA